MHCVLILQGVMSWGFRPALPLTWGSDPESYVRGVMSANRFPVQPELIASWLNWFYVLIAWVEGRV